MRFSLPQTHRHGTWVLEGTLGTMKFSLIYRSLLTGEETELNVEWWSLTRRAPSTPPSLGSYYGMFIGGPAWASPGLVTSQFAWLAFLGKKEWDITKIGYPFGGRLTQGFSGILASPGGHAVFALTLGHCLPPRIPYVHSPHTLPTELKFEEG